MWTTATPPLRGSRSSCWRPRPSTPAKRKSAGSAGRGALHSKRRHCAGLPEIFLIVPRSPRISISAAPSTTTSMVHLPRSTLPPPTMVALRWYGCAPAGAAATKTAAKTVSKRYMILLLGRASARGYPQGKESHPSRVDIGGADHAGLEVHRAGESIAAFGIVAASEHVDHTDDPVVAAGIVVYPGIHEFHPAPAEAVFGLPPNGILADADGLLDGEAAGRTAFFAGVHLRGADNAGIEVDGAGKAQAYVGNGATVGLDQAENQSLRPGLSSMRVLMNSTRRPRKRSWPRTQSWQTLMACSTVKRRGTRSGMRSGGRISPRPQMRSKV